MDKNVTLLPPSAFQSAPSRVTRSKGPSLRVPNLVGRTPSNLLSPTAQSAVRDPVAFLPQTNLAAINTTGCRTQPQWQVDQFGNGANTREAQLSGQLHVLEEQLHSRSNAYKAQIEKLEMEMRTILQQQQRGNAEHVKHIQDCELQLSEKNTQLEHLKCYVTENSTPSTQMCKKQLENSQHKIQILEKEKRDLESSVDLLNIRLKSHDHIQSIHDADISEAGDPTHDKKKQLLLKRWRTKVYELLVQLQSTDLIHRKDQQICKQRMCELESTFSGLKQQIELLQHALDDKNASLDMQLQQNKKLENELHSVENVALELDNINKGYQQAVNSLVQYANSMHERFVEKEEKYSKINQALQLYSQRITFASSRVEMLQSQFTRRDALFRVEIQKQNETQKADVETTDNNSGMYEDLQQEVARLAKERDSLARQNTQDILTLEQKLLQAREQSEHQIHELQERNSELHDKLQLQTAELSSAVEAVETSEEETRENEQTIEQLQERVEQLQNNVQQEIENAYESEQQKHRQELAELQQKLNDSAREHSKTVVSLRQMERQMGRECERMSEQSKSMDDYYKQHIVKLEHNIKELEKERNLLMTTLRQEGLVGKHRAARSSPVTWQPDQCPSDVTMEHSYDVMAQGQRTNFTAERSTDVLNSQHSDTFEPLNSTGDVQSQTEVNTGKDTYFEETGDTQQQDVSDVELADVIEEVRKLSEQVMEDSLGDDSSNDDVTQ